MELEFGGMNLGCALNSLRNLELPDRQCALPLLSKILGYSIIAASTIVKVPQIYLIAKNKSIQGLSITSFELEVVGFTIALAYCLFKGLAFSVYGELVFLLLQAIILVVLLYNYSPNPGVSLVLKSAAYCALAPTLLAGKVDPVTFETLYACQHAIFFFSRLPQIYENYKNKSTGQLSFITNFMSFAGCFVRLFTSIQEQAPTSMVVGSILGVLTNGVVMAQFLLYRNRRRTNRDH